MSSHTIYKGNINKTTAVCFPISFMVNKIIFCPNRVCILPVFVTLVLMLLNKSIISVEKKINCYNITEIKSVITL